MITRRRVLLTLGACTFARPLASAAQPRSDRVYRIGFLGVAFASGYVRELDWMRAGLRKLGYVEGRNLTIEYRWAEGNLARLQEFAAEFVALKVDAILTHALPGALAAAQVTSTVPIVMADGADPVAAGLARSIAQPGTNVTGSFSFIPEEVSKRLELLREILPQTKRVAYLTGQVTPVVAAQRAALRDAAAAMNVEIREFSIREAAELPEAFNGMEKGRMEALVVNNQPLLNSLVGVVAGLAAAKRLPAVGYASFADAGGLLAYGANRPALYGRAGYFLDRIFNGAKPGEIPFERAAKFDTIVNLKTAKALGLTIPQSVLLRVDRVIE